MGLRYALIGCGRIAPNHLSSAVIAGFDVIALCDIDPQAIETLLKECKMSGTGIEHFTDFRKLLDACHPDVVGIATESGCHAEIAKECLNRKIAVIVEKPMALALSDADEMIGLAEKYHIPLAVCQQNRLNYASKAVKDAIDSGAFGHISHIALCVRWCRGKNYYDQGTWRGTWAHDGGALMNQCIHGIDLLRWFGGTRINQVSGFLTNRFHPYLEVEDAGFALVEFSNGIIGTIEGTTNVFQDNMEETLTVIGEYGTVKLCGQTAESIGLWKFADSSKFKMKQKTFEQFSSVYGNGHAKVYADMKEAIKNKRQPSVNGQCGRDALELVLAIYKSHKEKGPVTLPIPDFHCSAMEI